MNQLPLRQALEIKFKMPCFQKFPGSPVVRTWRFPAGGPDSVPVQGTKILAGQRAKGGWGGRSHTSIHISQIRPFLLYPL